VAHQILQIAPFPPEGILTQTQRSSSGADPEELPWEIMQAVASSE